MKLRELAKSLMLLSVSERDIEDSAFEIEEVRARTRGIKANMKMAMGVANFILVVRAVFNWVD